MLQLQLFEAVPFIGMDERFAVRLNQTFHGCDVRVVTPTGIYSGKFTGILWGEAFAPGLFRGDVTVEVQRGRYHCVDWRSVREFEVLGPPRVECVRCDQWIEEGFVLKDEHGRPMHEYDCTDSYMAGLNA